MIKALAIIASLGLALPAAPALADAQTDYLVRICQSVLENQPHIVRKQTVAAVRPGTPVRIHSLCNGIDIQDLGNAAGLTKIIAANPTLATALARRGWRGDDVTGIVIGSGGVDLYVHRF